MKTDQAKSSTKFYTIAQIAECIDVSTRSVRRWIEKGLFSRPSDQRIGPDLRAGLPKFSRRTQGSVRGEKFPHWTQGNESVRGGLPKISKVIALVFLGITI